MTTPDIGRHRSDNFDYLDVCRHILMYVDICHPMSGVVILRREWSSYVGSGHPMSGVVSLRVILYGPRSGVVTLCRPMSPYVTLCHPMSMSAYVILRQPTLLNVILCLMGTTIAVGVRYYICRTRPKLSPTVKRSASAITITGFLKNERAHFPTRMYSVRGCRQWPPE